VDQNALGQIQYRPTPASVGGLDGLGPVLFQERIRTPGIPQHPQEDMLFHHQYS
jgi:hypothetical protein